ncbi:MAG: PAS domain S-box protein [Candidatus Lokiarchaeota archaeon]|nr:PAS domain S-box protein [Candidatus Lokiarchaeota archaeon]
MKVLILSRFDPKMGPKIYLKAPRDINDQEFDQIPALMDLYDEGFFIHIFGSYKSANCIFNIPSKHSRGQVETLLISFVVDINSHINFELSKELLEGFESEFQTIEDAFEAFYEDNEEYAHSQEKLEEIKSLFSTFYNTFPKESIVYEQTNAKILVFGLSQAGKTTVINCLRNSMSKNTIPTTYIDISKVIINNITMYAHDTPGQSKFKELWAPYLKNQDGLVFVLDVADKKQYRAAGEVLHDILNLNEMKNLPLLILLNKKDLLNPNLEEIKNTLELNGEFNRSIEYFSTCALKNENVEKGFYWLSERLNEKLHPAPKSELGLIFSYWDENKGPLIVSTYPGGAIDNPELVATRCFSISQFLFGGEYFKRISVILPFTHLKAKAAIYFDVIEDQNIRGGLLPLSLVIFFHERIPRAIIDQYTTLVFEKFTSLKANYLDEKHINEELKTIYDEILKKLISLEPTVKALRIAEMRYQSLFMSARDAILIIDRKSGIIVDANQQAEKIVQRPLEDIVGMHLTQLQLENQREGFKQKILTQLESEDAVPIELKIKIFGDKSIPVEINASEIQMGGQNIIQCIIRDITERKLSELKLKNSENKYRHLFKNTPFSIILIDSKGIVVDVNPAVESLLDYRREELLDKRFDRLNIIRPNFLLKLLEDLKNLKKGEGESITVLDAILTKKNQNTIIANIQSSQVMINREEFVQIIISDVTKQKIAEEMLRESQERYHKLYDRANFYKELFAQDVNNLFKKIESSIESYKETKIVQKNKNFIDMLENIKDQGVTGAKLISNVRKLALLEDSKLPIKKLFLNSFLEESIGHIKQGFKEKTITASIYPQNKNFFIMANEILSDVFDNILINIIEYNTNPNIRLEILISKINRNDVRCLKMEFIDTTLQYESVYREQEKERPRGTLLGLTFIDQIMTSLSGEFTVEGANFVIIVPEAL